MNLCHHGQRLAAQPFAAAYPCLLTTGLDDPQTYIYRGIVAHCCRVVDFLLTRPEVDTKIPLDAAYRSARTMFDAGMGG